MRINIARGLNLGSDDSEGWKKACLFALIVGLCAWLTGLILPGLALAFYGPGYLTQTVRQTALGDDDGRLPDVISGTPFWAGLMTMGLAVVYSLPFAIVAVLTLGASSMTHGLFGGGGSADLVEGASTAAQTFSPFAIAGTIVMALAVAVTPAVILQYVRRERFTDALKPTAIFFAMLESPLDYAVVVGVLLLATGIGSFVPVRFVGTMVGSLVALMGARLAGLYGAEVLNLGAETEAPLLPSE